MSVYETTRPQTQRPRSREMGECRMPSCPLVTWISRSFSLGPFAENYEICGFKSKVRQSFKEKYCFTMSFYESKAAEISAMVSKISLYNRKLLRTRIPSK